MGFPYGGGIQFLQVHRASGRAVISEHQLVGVPTGTASIMPSATSLSMSYFTLFFQWWGTGIDVWTAVGVAPGTEVMSNGLPAIACNGDGGNV